MSNGSLDSRTGYGVALFDLDGTLVESDATIDRHTRLWAERNDLDVAKVIALSHGLRDRDFIPMLVPSDRVETEIRWLHELSCRDTEGITAIPGAAELTAGLPAHAWAVVTSAARDVALRRLAAASLPRPLLLICAEQVVEGKPSPEGYLRAAEAMEVEPHTCLVFEDSPAGLLAARSAGMDAVAVGGGREAVYGTPVTDLRAVRIQVAPAGELLVTQRKPASAFIPSSFPPKSRKTRSIARK
ncbi:HAD-IA family hydrolase [Streptomyces sp. NPDC088260]|uniref:HAD-IA family hydrolase n=1 Tax=Streptomyces sp. NPDC088260 TaxID=3365850 RepID=UPI00382AC206